MLTHTRHLVYRRLCKLSRSFIQNRAYHVELPENTSLPDFMLERMKLWPGKTALIDASTEKSVTYDDMCSMSRSIGSALWRRGMRQSEALCIVSPNCVEYPAIMFGTNLIGGTFAVTNPQYTIYELTKQLVETQTSYVATIPQLLPKIDEIAKQVKSIKNVFVIGNMTAGLESISDLARENVDLPDVKINAKKDTAALFFSSGTTGEPKPVKLSHHGLISAVAGLGPGGLELHKHDGSDIIGCLFPFFHIGGNQTALLGFLYTGNQMVIFPTFDYTTFLKAIPKYKFTSLVLPPSVVARLGTDPEVDSYDLSSVTKILSGASPVSPKSVKDTRERLGIQDIRAAYGATEFGGVSHMTLKEHAAKLEHCSVGVAVPNYETKIVDPETKQEVEIGKQGEILIRSPGLMLGYLNNEEATKASFTEDGWILSGDLGYIDEDGCLFVLGRLKDLIKYKGNQVSPGELENVLLSHPAVAEAAVLGVPDERAGELPRAYVALKTGMTATEQEISDHMKDKLAPHKQLRGGVVFVESLPRNPAGKVMLHVLRKTPQDDAK